MFSGFAAKFSELTSSTFPGKIQDPAVLKQKWEKKRVLIVGGTAGIGRGLAIYLIKNNVSVTIVGTRDPDPELHKAKFIRKDLSLMKNAIALVAEVDSPTLDIIVFTVGVFAGSEREQTEDGIERDLAISYLSRLAFTKKLVETCKFGTKRVDKSTKPRIFVMGIER
jgi:NAD(P)-dependent dehydrogenase (short-subunit alcohol dehydrogenase family)